MDRRDFLFAGTAFGLGLLHPAVTHAATTWPLSVAPGGRYLVDAAGVPFLVHGDTCWSIVGQLTNAQIDTYLNDRAARGFNALLFSAPEAYYTSQTPSYLNVDGAAPFATATDFASPNGAYWNRVDYLVNGAKARGMACVINPAYIGYATDGWLDAISAAPDADLRAYGAWLANRYWQGNVIWSMGGDHDGPPALLAKQWNIVSGMRSVRTTDIVTAHPLADAGNADDAYTYWAGLPGFALNWVYGYETSGFHTYALCAQAYRRPGPMPFIGFEFKYENSAGASLAMLRRQSYGSLLSGACGQFYGNLPIWHFGSPRWNEPYAGGWQTHLGSAGAVQQAHVKALFSSCEWWKLEPRTDTSLVSSSLGSNAARVYPARARDGSFAMIYVPSSQSVTVAMSALSPASVRVRLYDPVTGAYSTVSGSPFGNGGTRTIATGGERVVVLDSAALLPAPSNLRVVG